RVQKVYFEDGWLKDVEASSRKLAQAAHSWHQRGFFISRKETWTGRTGKQWEFSGEQRNTIVRIIPGILKCDDQTAMDAVERFLGFLAAHSANSIPMTAIPTIL